MLAFLYLRFNSNKKIFQIRLKYYNNYLTMKRGQHADAALVSFSEFLKYEKKNKTLESK